MALAEDLQKIGLQEKEAAVFLAALELGSAPISVIARRANIKRPTAHYVVRALTERGLLAKIPKKKRVLYAAVPPDRLRHELNEHQRILGIMLPSLESIYRSRPTQPNVRFYEGQEGLQTAYSEFYATHKTLYAVTSMERVYSAFSDADMGYFLGLLRDSGGQLIELVHQTPSGAQYMASLYRKKVSRAKYLPADVYFSIDLIASEEKVAFFSFHTLLAVIIDDADIAHSQKSLIAYLWQSAKNRKL